MFCAQHVPELEIIDLNRYSAKTQAFGLCDILVQGIVMQPLTVGNEVLVLWKVQKSMFHEDESFLDPLPFGVNFIRDGRRAAGD
jgi:hypothetical protein